MHRLPVQDYLKSGGVRYNLSFKIQLKETLEGNLQ